MTSKKAVVEQYFAAMSAVDRPAVLDCLTEDVEWRIVTAGESMRGKTEFAQNIGTPPDVDRVRIDASRMTEEGDVVVAEGTVHLSRRGGGSTVFEFCDVFEFRESKIRRLNTFTAERK